MSASNSQKTPCVDTLSRYVRGKTQDREIQTGRSWPCSVVSVSGSIVTVNFEVTSDYTLPRVTIPVFGAQYIRQPLQPGDRGVALSADAYLGGVSGLGGGVADLTERGNLSALVFFPIGNTGFAPVDPNAVVVYGPNGVVLRDAGSAVTFTLTPEGITINGNITLNGTITATGNVVAGSGTADQVGLQTHRHGTTGTAAASTSAPSAGT